MRVFDVAQNQRKDPGVLSCSGSGKTLQMLKHLKKMSLPEIPGWPFRKRVRQEHKYAFILCPPYCGSTLLSQILASSKNVSINNPQGTCEGQTLPEVRDHLFVANRWDSKLPVDWPMVKQVWHHYWDPKRPIFLEKSPPNILRADQIESHFQPAYFFVMWRNPYAHCESQIRRNGNQPGDAAGFAIRCLEIQRQNIRKLRNVLPVSYEELTAEPSRFVRQANEFLPELGKLRVSGDFNVHNHLDEKLGIRDLNQEKIALLSETERHEINSVFSQSTATLDYFGYRFMD